MNLPNARRTFVRTGKQLRRARWLYVGLFVRPALASCTSDGERDKVMDTAEQRMHESGLYAASSNNRSRRQGILCSLYRIDGGLSGKHGKLDWWKWVTREGWRPCEARSCKFKAQARAS
jgi:hypothetical protein